MPWSHQAADLFPVYGVKEGAERWARNAERHNCGVGRDFNPPHDGSYKSECQGTVLFSSLKKEVVFASCFVFTRALKKKTQLCITHATNDVGPFLERTVSPRPQGTHRTAIPDSIQGRRAKLSAECTPKRNFLYEKEREREGYKEYVDGRAQRNYGIVVLGLWTGYLFFFVRFVAAIWEKTESWHKCIYETGGEEKTSPCCEEMTTSDANEEDK